MTDKEINRATITAFLARCINRGAGMALDVEFGLRVRGAERIDGGLVRIEFAGGHIAIVNVDRVLMLGSAKTEAT